MVATLSVWAQVPQTLTYQAVVRDGNGRLICNSNVGVRISILQGSEIGVAVYSDQQTVRTNANGLFTLLIGTAENSISGIDWAVGPYFLKSEIDHAGGTNYTLTTVQQMFSVPYALRAHTADSVIGGVSTNEVDPVFSAWDKDYNDLINRPTIPTALSELNNDVDYITATDVQTVINDFTSNAGYMTSYTETQTLSDVATLGNNIGTQIKQLSDPTEQLDAVNLRTLNTMISLLSASLDSIMHRYDSIISEQNELIDSLQDLISDVSPTYPYGGFDGNGASYALFSVSETKQVRFSKGNLQFTTVGTHATANGGTSAGIWRFAEHQYDIIGSGNDNISSTYTGWIDIFGRGTSGWNSGASIYQPWGSSSSNTATDYNTNSLTGENAFADWGEYNAISNGGNQPSMWRTLTSDEWEYLISGRENSISKYGVATVAGTPGMILLPDNWENPIGLQFIPGRVLSGLDDSKFEVNTYTSEQWIKMEMNGAIFLPFDINRPTEGYSYWGSAGYLTPSWRANVGGYNTSQTGGHSYFILATIYSSTISYHKEYVRLVQD